MLLVVAATLNSRSTSKFSYSAQHESFTTFEDRMAELQQLIPLTFGMPLPADIASLFHSPTPAQSGSVSILQGS